jgi:hypothetical protein
VPRFFHFATVATIFFLAQSAPAEESATKSDSPAAEFKPLYNGRDLAGWKVKDGKIESWKGDGELLSCIGAQGGWLRTEKAYSDFVLKLEYRIPPGGNSGIGLRFPAEGNPAHVGMEVQILDDDAPEFKDLAETQYNGGIYCQAAARRGAAKPPGEWNEYEINCLGPAVKVVLNGQTIVEIEVDSFREGAGEHPALADRPETGFIGLQSHGARVDFRNIQISDLTTTTESGLHYVDLTKGTGALVPAGATVTVHYTGRFVDGKKFDSSRDRDKADPLPLNQMIKGWQEGLTGMKVGGRRKLIIPPQLAYGEKGAEGVIPPNATLIFDVEVLEVE